jgi:hypothetical protein
MSVRSACFSDEVFLENAKILVLGLLSSTAGISGFPNYQMIKGVLLYFLHNLPTCLQEYFQNVYHILITVLQDGETLLPQETQPAFWRSVASSYKYCTIYLIDYQLT